MAFDPRWKNPQGSSPEMLYLWAQDIIKELRRGQFIPSPQDAAGVAYDNTVSGLAATDVQAAIDEEDARIDALEDPPAGLRRLAFGTVVNQPTLDIVLTAYTAYRGLRFVLSSFVPATDDVELGVRLSTNAGVNFDATGYSRTLAWSRDGSVSGSNNQSAADTEILVAGSQSNGEAVSNVAAEGGVDAIVDIFNQTDTARWPRVMITSSQWFGATDTFSARGSGSRETAQDTDAIRFLFESGNIASGNWAVYGYA